MSDKKWDIEAIWIVLAFFFIALPLSIALSAGCIYVMLSALRLLCGSF